MEDERMGEKGRFWIFPREVEVIGRSGDDLIVGDEEGVESIAPSGEFVDFTWPELP